MYNKQLETFLVIVNSGSFNKAAQKLFISASAVIQQINSLEQDLGVSLFIRTRQGIMLTDAGKYLAGEAEAYIEKGKAIRSRLKAIGGQTHSIAVGTSVENKCRLLYDLWMLFHPEKEHYEVRLCQLEPDAEISPEIELIESIRDHAPWQKGWAFLEITRVPIAYAVSKNHPLVSEKYISFSQMQKHAPVVIDRSGSRKLTELFDILDREHIHYDLNKGWDSDFVWNCSVNNRALLVPSCWEDVLFDFEMKPCELEFSLPYGFFYRKTPHAGTRAFLEFVDSVYSGRDPQGIVPVF